MAIIEETALKPFLENVRLKAKSFPTFKEEISI